MSIGGSDRRSTQGKRIWDKNLKAARPALKRKPGAVTSNTEASGTKTQKIRKWGRTEQVEYKPLQTFGILSEEPTIPLYLADLCLNKEVGDIHRKALIKEVIENLVKEIEENAEDSGFTFFRDHILPKEDDEAATTGEDDIFSNQKSEEIPETETKKTSKKMKAQKTLETKEKTPDTVLPVSRQALDKINQDVYYVEGLKKMPKSNDLRKREFFEALKEAAEEEDPEAYKELFYDEVIERTHFLLSNSFKALEEDNVKHQEEEKKRSV